MRKYHLVFFLILTIRLQSLYQIKIYYLCNGQVNLISRKCFKKQNKDKNSNTPFDSSNSTIKAHKNNMVSHYNSFLFVQLELFFGLEYMLVYKHFDQLNK